MVVNENKLFRDKVYIVIVNYNGWADTIECIDSILLAKYHNVCVIIVDNKSTDDSIDKLNSYGNNKSLRNPKLIFNKISSEHAISNMNDISESSKFDYKEIVLITSDKNLGFSGGNNIGIIHAVHLNAKYVMLLNNDTTVQEDFIEPLINTIESNNDIGVVGGKIYDYYNKEKFISGGYIDVLKGSGYHFYDKNFFNNTEVTYLSGCFWFFKGEIFKEIGLLDENFFLYIEDVEYCFRMRKFNKKLIYNPQSEIYHKESQSTGKNSPLVTYYNTRNRLYFVSKYYSSKWNKILFSIFFIVTRLIKALNNYEHSIYIRKGFKDYRDGKFGKIDNLNSSSNNPNINF